VSCTLRFARGRHVALRIALLIPLLATGAAAIDWSVAEQQLAHKITAAIGNGPASLSVENRSRLGRRDADIIQNGIRSALEGVGVRFGPADKSPFAVTISLSENSTSYVWVAEIRHGSDVPIVAIVSTARPPSIDAAHDSVPLTLRMVSLWRQSNPILDVAVLEEGVSPTRIAVLDAEKVALYKMQDGKSVLEQSFNIQHDKPWPRDLRGRLLPAADRTLDVYLPAVVCHGVWSSSAFLNCRSSDSPWPIVGGSAAPKAFLLSAFFSPTRNFFIGALNASGETLHAVSPFYSAASLPRGNSVNWLFSGVDGQFHQISDASERVMRLKWGTELASVRTACGSGWQVLASGSDEGTSDSVRAYEFPDRDPVPVSAAVEFPGPVSALWTEAKADTAVAISKNEETGDYEAFRLAVACSH
jgi:hypothetical protein